MRGIWKQCYLLRSKPTAFSKDIILSYSPETNTTIYNYKKLAYFKYVYTAVEQQAVI